MFVICDILLNLVNVMIGISISVMNIMYFCIKFVRFIVKKLLSSV